MRITIESTRRLTTVGGVPCRVWEGVTGRGVKRTVFVRLISVLDGADSREFDRELIETPPPAEMTPLREVLP